MRILVIGGTGLISSQICRQLAGGGHRTVLYNRGVSAGGAPDGTETILGDRTDYGRFAAQIGSAGTFDAVIDMVSYRPADAESAAAVFAGKTPQLILCSTVDVYAKPAARYPYTESEGYGGLNEYSSNKVLIERRLARAESEGAFGLTIIRPAYTYGEGRGPIHPVSWGRYIDRTRKGKPTIVQGDGQSLWTCAHASDVAQAFVGACGNPAAIGQAYHAAGEEWMTWDQYHQQAAEALGVPCPPLVHIPSDLLCAMGVPICAENFQFDNIFDNLKAKRDLGFTYKVTWREGVRRMAAWFDKNPGSLEHCGDGDLEEHILAAWEAGRQKTLESFAGWSG